jgi:hypothetical protein
MPSHYCALISRKRLHERRKAQQKELLAKIAKLEASAKKDKALEKGLREMKKQADHIVKEPAGGRVYRHALPA